MHIRIFKKDNDRESHKNFCHISGINFAIDDAEFTTKLKTKNFGHNFDQLQIVTIVTLLFLETNDTKEETAYPIIAALSDLRNFEETFTVNSASETKIDETSKFYFVGKASQYSGRTL